MSVGNGRQNIIILFWKYQFHFWENINGNQTFILDFHRPFICSAVTLHVPHGSAKDFSAVPIAAAQRRNPWESNLLLASNLAELPTFYRVRLLTCTFSFLYLLPFSLILKKSTSFLHTTLQRKSHVCVPRKGTARPQSQFPHSCVRED